MTIYLGMKAENTLLMFIPVVTSAVFHVFYVPIIMFISLKTEANQLHLWLHNPQPASTLLLSKIVNGLIMIVISLLMLYVCLDC
jgi:NADH:ubiquinone oxidoreductase subunit 2 (subunit N)